jgi:hypothetical protein
MTDDQSLVVVYSAHANRSFDCCTNLMVFRQVYHVGSFALHVDVIVILLDLWSSICIFTVRTTVSAYVGSKSSSCFVLEHECYV